MMELLYGIVTKELMKKQLIYTAVLISSAAALSSCFEKEEPPVEPVKAQEPAKPEPPAQPTNEEISRLILEQLPVCERATSGELSCDPLGKNDDGSLNITAHLSMIVKENLYNKEVAPAEFNKERQAANEAANNAMKPEATYLMQIGAPTDFITEEDRRAKALPADLQALLNELKELADGVVFRKTVEAGKEVSVTINFHATRKEDSWVYDNIVLDNANLLALDDLTPESALNPETDNVLTPEFEGMRKQLIKEKTNAFNEAARPYILSREEAARATFTQKQAQMEEQQLKAKEEQDAAMSAQEKRVKHFASMLAGGKTFAGEWVRGDHFGEISLSISQSKLVTGDTIQFTGTIFDTKLTEASLDIEGRCELSSNEQKVQIKIVIYDGQYDPDQPTAEVYDAKDGQLVLYLTEDGKLVGTMRRASWGEDSDRAFSINLMPKAE